MSFKRIANKIHRKPKTPVSGKVDSPKTNTVVVGSGRSSSRRRLLIVPAIAVAVIAVAAFLLYNNRNSNTSYQVGGHGFSEQDVNDLAGVLAKNGSSDGTYEDAKRRYILLSALKSEADQRGISYGSTEIEAFLQDTYKKQGGKDKYLSYMQSQYGWSAQDVMLHQTTEYLKTKLQNDLLSKRSYSSVYVRWDSINLFYPDKTKAKEVYDLRFDILSKHFVPLFEQKATNEEISKLVHIVDEMDPNEANKVFMQQQGAPIYFKKWLPEQQIAIDPSLKHQEGEELGTQLRTLKEVGDFVGPVKANSGMLIIVRLDEVMGGAYVDWDHLAAEYAKRSGIQESTSEPNDKITDAIRLAPTGLLARSAQERI